MTLPDSKGQGPVFISYSREDADRVEHLVSELEAAGIEVWLDKARMLAGDLWEEEIRKAIRDCAVFVACFSRRSESRERGYQYKELRLAAHQYVWMRPSDAWLRIVRFDDCVVPDINLGVDLTLNSILRSDLFDDEDWGEEIAKLVESIRRSIARRFVGRLVRLHELAGFRDYARLADHMGTGYSREILANSLSGESTRCPDWPFVAALVQACHQYSAEAGGHPDPALALGSETAWRTSWEAARAGMVAAVPVAPHSRRPPKEDSSDDAARANKLLAERRRARVLDDVGLVETLRAIYPRYPLVQLWGRTMPICEFPAPPGQWDDIDSVCGELGDRRLPGPAEYSEDFDPGGRKAFDSYVSRYADAGKLDRRHFYPGATYAIDRIRIGPDGRIALDCAMGRYFAAMATSEDLDAELMAALAADPSRSVALHDLARRAWLHRSVENGDPVLDGSHRSGAVSHATVVMMAAGEGEGAYDVLLPPRSQDVATHAHFNHVAPSGIFSPFVYDSPSPLREFSVTRNLYREWVEELYALEDHERPPYLEVPDPEDEPEITRLKQLLASGGASLYFTGVSVNLLTLRPEICLLLAIDDPDWLSREQRTAREIGRPFQFSWEFAQGPGNVRQRVPEQSEHWRLRLNDERRPMEEQVPRASFLVPNAAAALSLAMRVLESRSAATS